MKPTITLAESSIKGRAKLVLQEHDGEFTLRIDGVLLMSTSASYSEMEMAAVACQYVPEKSPRVLIGGLGFGFTLRRVLELMPAEAHVVVAEILPEVIAWNREFLMEVNGSLLDDPRVNLRKEDVHSILTKAQRRGFDHILLDVDNSPNPLVQRGNARLYSAKGLELIYGALRPGGRAVFWSANRDPRFQAALERVFGKVQSLGAKAYPQAKRFSHTLFVADR
ncbi:MAG: spermine synthase [Planctomycetes bacterium]|nr:spermine synthase [Planctomycetota bacterium]HPF13780.1 spermine synthase [Planctomycetota bacterium]HRV79892.1 spermine synthase [Planctomycetota bacterium]